MYYQNLMILEEDLLDSDISNIELLNKLDDWLAASSMYNLERLNPYQFSLDSNVNERDAVAIFLLGSSKSLFKIRYEVTSDGNEYLGTLTEEEYIRLFRRNEIIHLYSRELDDELRIYRHNIELWFSLSMKPILVPQSVNVKKHKPLH